MQAIISTKYLTPLKAQSPSFDVFYLYEIGRILWPKIRELLGQVTNLL